MLHRHLSLLLGKHLTRTRFIFTCLGGLLLTACGGLSNSADELALLPPPNLENITVTTGSETGETSFAIVQGSGFDATLEGDSLVITHVSGSASLLDSAPAQRYLARLKNLLLAEARADTNPCEAAETTITCVTITNGAIPATRIENFNAGDSLSFAFYDPETATQSDATALDAATVEEAAQTQIYLGLVAASPKAIFANTTGVYLASADGQVAALLYNDPFTLSPDVGSLDLEDPTQIAAWTNNDTDYTSDNYEVSQFMMVDDMDSDDNDEAVFLLSNLSCCGIVQISRRVQNIAGNFA